MCCCKVVIDISIDLTICCCCGQFVCGMVLVFRYTAGLTLVWFSCCLVFMFEFDSVEL